MILRTRIRQTDMGNARPEGGTPVKFSLELIYLQDEHPEPAYAASQRCPSLIGSQ